MDMTIDLLAKHSYGKIALLKIKPESPNFRLYEAGWLETGGGPETWEVMEVTGAEFREAKSGPNKGKLTVLVPNTKRTAHVNVQEMRDFEEGNRPAQ